MNNLSILRKTLVNKKNEELAELQKSGLSFKMKGIAFLYDRRIKQIDNQISGKKVADLAKTVKKTMVGIK